MSTIFQRLGAVGLVSDCGVRDIDEVRNLHFHYFARGSVVSHARFRIVRVGVPVQILGTVIRPGDILYGDENGRLLVPPCTVDEIRQKVEDIRSHEKRLMDFVRRSDFSLERLKGRFIE